MSTDPDVDARPDDGATDPVDAEYDDGAADGSDHPVPEAAEVEFSEVDADVDPKTADPESLGRALGEVIARTPEYEAFEAATEAVETDEEAQERIADFERQRSEFVMARQTGQATQEDLRDLQATQRDLHSLPVMEEYLAAQEALQSRLEGINEAISAPLSVDFGGEAGGCCQD